MISPLSGSSSPNAPPSNTLSGTFRNLFQFFFGRNTLSSQNPNLLKDKELIEVLTRALREDNSLSIPDIRRIDYVFDKVIERIPEEEKDNYEITYHLTSIQASIKARQREKEEHNKAISYIKESNIGNEKQFVLRIAQLIRRLENKLAYFEIGEIDIEFQFVISCLPRETRKQLEKQYNSAFKKAINRARKEKRDQMKFECMQICDLRMNALTTASSIEEECVVLQKMKKDCVEKNISWKDFLNLLLFENEHTFFKLCDSIIKTENQEDIDLCLEFLSYGDLETFLSLYGDIIFVLDGKEMPHRSALLSLSTQYFSRMMNSHTKEAQSSVVDIPDISYALFRQAISYGLSRYNKVRINKNNFQELLFLANRYELKDLKKACEGWVCNRISDFNEDELFELAEACQSENIAQRFVHHLIMECHLKGEFPIDARLKLEKWVKNLHSIEIDDSIPSLEVLQCIFDASQIETLRVTVHHQKTLEFLCTIKTLRTVDLTIDSSQNAFPKDFNKVPLRSLNLQNSYTIPSLENLPSCLQHLTINGRSDWKMRRWEMRVDCSLLHHCSNLRTLKLVDCELSNVDFSIFQDATKLETISLELPYNPIAGLENLTSLRSLTLINRSADRRFALQSLEPLSQLHSLTLDTKIEGFWPLSLSNLRHLSLGKHDEEEKDFIPLAAQLDQLKSLELNYFCNEYSSVFPNLTSLTSLSIGGCENLEFVNELHQLKKLSHLEIDNSNCRQFLVPIEEFLPILQLKSLKKLHLTVFRKRNFQIFSCLETTLTRVRNRRNNICYKSGPLYS